MSALGAAEAAFGDEVRAGLPDGWHERTPVVGERAREFGWTKGFALTFRGKPQEHRSNGDRKSVV